MEIGYDIFQQVDGNLLVWVDRVPKLQQARDRILNLESASPGTYLIYNAKKKTVLEASGEHRLTPCVKSGEKELALEREIDHRGIFGSFIGVCKRRLAELNLQWSEFIRDMGAEVTRVRCDYTPRQIQKAKNKWFDL